MEIVDHRLVGALHLDLLRHAGLAGLDDDGVVQTATIEALLDGAYDGDVTIGELLEHGDLGIGTLDRLDGELVVIDGEAWVARTDGRLHRVPPETGTPFAVVCRFRPTTAVTLDRCDGFDALTRSLDEALPADPVLALRIDGTFDHLVVRSVGRQSPPYPPLRDVVAHQREWALRDVTGTLVGFRFPDRTDGAEVPGWHLHAVDADRTVGGHVTDLRLRGGATVRAEATDALRLELPAAVATPGPGADRRAELDAVEGRRRPAAEP